jgi:hypothetical protein
MVDQAPQRVWRASCSFCGAPVEFRSAASPMAVCSYCKSTLVRDGETLRRIGQSADLFDDHSPLALGARGRYQDEPFTLIGRIQMAYRSLTAASSEADAGRWSEWHALFDNGRSAWLSEDNGAYVMSVAQPPDHALPDLNKARLGESLIVEQQPWMLGSIVMARVIAAQGELASQPDFKNSFKLFELRNTQDEVLSIDTSEQPPRCYIGRAVELFALQLSGLSDAKQPAEATLAGKGIECPNCGAALSPRLSDSQSIVCGACHSVVDISRGLGADLAHYQQDNGDEPLIPLGSTGKLLVEGRSDEWQVVGYQERCDIPAPGSDDESTFWREYLLYNRTRGFAFLVDAEDGWSVVKPVTGVPSNRQGDTLTLRGATYRKQFTYQAMTTYVLGEFYWRVRRDQRSQNTDYIGTGSYRNRRLSCEEADGEITWSVGQTLSAKDLLIAFGLKNATEARFARDVRPLSVSMSSDVPAWVSQAVIWGTIALVILVLTQCTDDCDDVRDQYGSSSTEYQQCRASSGSGSGWHGGSYGGYNSGGFHK